MKTLFLYIAFYFSPKPMGEQASIIIIMKEVALNAQNLFGIHLSTAQLQDLSHYQDMLLDWNTRFNLTAIDEPAKVRTKHFLDSLSCLLVMRDRPPKRLIDIGTGAGFPGLPIKIAFPLTQLTLVESVGKKADFCRHVVEELNLQRVEVLTVRAEEVGRLPDHREQYDWSIARAVAAMPVLVEYLLPLVKDRRQRFGHEGRKCTLRNTHSLARHLFAGR